MTETSAPTPEGSPVRTALVTGGSRGLGSSVAELLGAEGFRLILTARHRDPLEAEASRLRARGYTVNALAGAVEDPAHRGALREAVESHGELQLLINNASELGATPLPPMVEYDPEVLAHVFDVNVFAPLALVRELIGPLVRSRGLVVNISSDAAIVPYAGWGAYGSSKAALDLLTRTLALELRPRGVSVVGVDPGDMRTEMQQAAFPGEDISDRPLPEVTRPFWAWMLGQDPAQLSGARLRAQGERWELPA